MSKSVGLLLVGGFILFAGSLIIDEAEARAGIGSDVFFTGLGPLVPVLIVALAFSVLALALVREFEGMSL